MSDNVIVQFVGFEMAWRMPVAMLVGVIPGKRVNERRKSESEAILSAAGLILAQRSNGIDSTGAMGRSKTCQ